MPPGAQIDDRVSPSIGPHRSNCKADLKWPARLPSPAEPDPLQGRRMTGIPLRIHTPRSTFASVALKCRARGRAAREIQFPLGKRRTNTNWAQRIPWHSEESDPAVGLLPPPLLD